MLILASKSAVRQHLLTQAGLAFSVQSAAVDERLLGEGVTSSASAVARHLAGAKALAVSAQFPKAIVIGADQTLALAGKAFHKPTSLKEAKAQLAELRGNTHDLCAGVALAQNGKLLWDHVAAARLTMRAFTDSERDHILELEGEEILACVGAYRLEGPSVQLFERIEGDYFSILGLPLLPLLAALRHHAPDLFETRS